MKVTSARNSPAQTFSARQAMSTAGLIGLALGISLTTAHAAVVSTDSFGSGGGAFTIDFVTVGNVGNANDAGVGGGFYSFARE